MGQLQLLVVDDGSTDDTWAVLLEFARRHTNISLLRNRCNRGRAVARNQILENVETEYLAWIDSDDIWYPSKIRKQFQVLRARKDDLGILCTCSYKLIWVGSGRSTIRRSRLSGDQLKNCLDTTLYPYLWTMLGRTRTFQSVGRFDERFRRRQDFEFILRFLVGGGRVVTSDPDIPLCEYHRTDLGRSGWQIAKANRLVWKRYREIYRQYGLAYAYERRAAQHALTARFFEANGDHLFARCYSARGRLVSIQQRIAERKAKPPRHLTAAEAEQGDSQGLKRAIFGKDVSRPPLPVPPRAPDEVHAGRTEYDLNERDDFVLYRIIGNDLPPRHAEGQVIRNLLFILEHEQAFPSCEKRWIVNRIASPQVERQIVELLERYGQSYLVVPFNYEHYRRIGLDFDAFPEPGVFWPSRYDKLGAGDKRRITMHAFRRKNIYAMNNNGARNLALRDGRQRAKWVMPWDGSCFLTPSAWQQIQRQVSEHPQYKYVLVPMARVLDNSVLLSDGEITEANEEPQIIFRRDALECFNESWPYGRRPKVELLWRLGVPWKWEHWVNQPWDPEVPQLSSDAGSYCFAGWVARLDSGQPEYDAQGREAFLRRGVAREAAVIAALKRFDSFGLKAVHGPAAIDSEVLRRQAADASYSEAVRVLLAEADEALQRGPYTVVAKRYAEVGTLNDYWFPAPYWWPNPETLNGRPYVRVAGRRVPGTKPGDRHFERFDRHRLQRVCDDTLVLALAHCVTGRPRYAYHALALLRSWFLDETTRMNPHLKYAEVKQGHNNDHGTGRGIIQSQSFWYLLEAIRLLDANAGIYRSEAEGIKLWFSQYLDWLLESPQGRWAQARVDFHGAYYELQVSAIAAFLNASEIYLESFYRAEEKIHHQIRALSSAGNANTQGEVPSISRLAFSLMAWTNLHYITNAYGTDLWEIDTVRAGIKKALERCFSDLTAAPADDEGWDIALPLRSAYIACFDDAPRLADLLKGAQEYYLGQSYQGVRPFWMLGLQHVPLPKDGALLVFAQGS